ncbi:MAG TPA: response regulator transcription factor [Ktedonobacteraceae bacterium]|nr:response regulator transcription factor [Ktedonobacteraceae bacterium]
MSSKHSEQASLRILVADDHFIVREGLRLILESEPDFVLVGDAADSSAAVRQVGELQPDVVLMDLRMPGMGGLEAIEQIRQQWPRVAVVILTTYDDDELMLKGLRAGASGYLLKNVDRITLFHAIRAAARGETLLPSATLARLLEGVMFTSSRVSKPQKPGGRAGDIALTQREQAVLEAVARGKRNKEIATHLGIGEPTVKTHLVNLYAKLDVDSRASAVAVAIELGLLTLMKKSVR